MRAELNGFEAFLQGAMRKGMSIDMGLLSGQVFRLVKIDGLDPATVVIEHSNGTQTVITRPCLVWVRAS